MKRQSAVEVPTKSRATTFSLVIHVLLLANAAWGPLRLSNAAANYAVMFFGLGLSWSIAFAAWRLPSRWHRIPALAVASVWIMWCSFLGAVTYSDFASTLKDGNDLGFEPIHRWTINGSSVVAYRTNGGATTRFGIVVRAEREVLPGVLWVRGVFSAYPADEVGYTLLPPDRVRFESPPYGDGNPMPISEEVPL